MLTVRECLTQFQGSEVIIALVLFCWLIVTALGSLTVRWIRRTSLTFYALLTLFCGVWPLPQLLLIRNLRRAFWIYGQSAGFYDILSFIFLTTAPYCLMVGFLLPYALKVLKDRDVPWTAGQLYVTDNVGDILGGGLFSFFLVYWMTPFAALAVSSALLLATALFLLARLHHYGLGAGGLLLVILFCGLAWNGAFERASLAGQYGHILHYMESPYGRIVISREGTQHTFWESGLALYSEGDIIESEEKVHYPLSQLEGVGNVLLISGGLGETLDEVIKHKPAGVDYVELDPHLTKAALMMGVIRTAARLRIVHDDGRFFIRNRNRRYDAVIVDLPDPDTFQLNRFFTSEFFGLVRETLTARGIFSFSLSYSPNYLGPARQAILSSVLRTARRHFEDVLILPGEKAYFLCRNGPVRRDIPALLRAKGIRTTYVAGFYHGNVTGERVRSLMENLVDDAPINRDFYPRVMGMVFKERLQKHGDSPLYLILALLGVTGVYLALIRREEVVLFSTGLVTMGAEMAVIMAFQVIYGVVYLKVGVVITAFLAGLLPGALLGTWRNVRPFPGLVVSEAALIGLLSLCLWWAVCLRSEIQAFWFPAFGFVFSFLCGFQFPMAARLIGEDRSPAAGCIAADLAGAALGTLMIGALLIPLWGMVRTLLVLTAVKVSSLLIVGFGLRR